MVPVLCNRQENFKWFRYNDIPGDYLGSLVSLDSGAKGDLRKVRIGVRVRARDSCFQKQATQEPLVQILIFWNHSVKSPKPLGQNLLPYRHHLAMAVCIAIVLHTYSPIVAYVNILLIQPYFMYTICKIRLYTSAPIEDTQRRSTLQWTEKQQIFLQCSICISLS